MRYEGCWHLTLTGARVPFGCPDKVRESSWVQWKRQCQVLCGSVFSDLI